MIIDKHIVFHFNEKNDTGNTHTFIHTKAKRVVSQAVSRWELTFSPVIQYIQQEHRHVVSLNTYPCLSYKCWAGLLVATKRNMDCRTEKNN